MIPEGHIVAYEQFKLPFASNLPVLSPAGGVLTIQNAATGIVITGNNFVVAFDSLGWLASYNVEGREIIQSALRPNFWRAPNDNDYGNNMPARLKVWKNAANDLKVISVKTRQLSQVYIEVTALYDIPSVKGTWKSTYLVFSDGRIEVKNLFNTADRNLPEIPRIGMRMRLNPEYMNMSYFGRGPWENYPDRKTSALISGYTGKVSDQFFLYVRPQENNYHTDVRWFSLTNEDGKGLQVSGNPTFCTSALNNAMEDFDDGEKKDQRHITDIVPSGFVEWCIDYKQMGVGGDDSWGAKPLPRYMLYPGYYTYEFMIKPL